MIKKLTGEFNKTLYIIYRREDGFLPENGSFARGQDYLSSSNRGKLLEGEFPLFWLLRQPFIGHFCIAKTFFYAEVNKKEDIQELSDILKQVYRDKIIEEAEYFDRILLRDQALRMGNLLAK